MSRFHPRRRSLDVRSCFRRPCTPATQQFGRWCTNKGPERSKSSHTVKPDVYDTRRCFVRARDQESSVAIRSPICGSRSYKASVLCVDPGNKIKILLRAFRCQNLSGRLSSSVAYDPRSLTARSHRISRVAASPSAASVVRAARFCQQDPAVLCITSPTPPSPLPLCVLHIPRRGSAETSDTQSMQHDRQRCPRRCPTAAAARTLPPLPRRERAPLSDESDSAERGDSANQQESRRGALQLHRLVSSPLPSVLDPIPVGNSGARHSDGGAASQRSDCRIAR